MSRILDFVSLNYFLVSRHRKLQLVSMLGLLVLALYITQVVTISVLYVSQLLQLATIFLTAYVIVTLVRFTVVTAYRRRNNLKAGTFDNVIIATDSTASVVTFLITAGSFFPIFGVPFISFLASLGFLAVGLAILLRDYAKNFIDGFRILYTKDFLIGDYVKTKNDLAGVITNISFRATKIKTEAGDTAYVPNTAMMNGEMVNYSKSQHLIVIPLKLNVEAGLDLADFEKYIVTELRTGEIITDEQKITFLIKALEKDTADLSVEIPVAGYSFRQEARIKDAVIRSALAYIKIHCPKPVEKQKTE